MGKNNGLVIEVEPKPLHEPEVIIKAQTENLKHGLEKLKTKFKKPKIKITFGDRVFYYGSKFGSWLIDTGSKFAGKTLRQIIPFWFWLALIGVIAAIILIIVL